jgi:hypothetical protein
MAQLGDLVRAKALLRARRAPSAEEAVARARCVVAEAEVALVSRDLGWPARRSTRRARRSKSTATGSTRRMRGISRSGASADRAHRRSRACAAATRPRAVPPASRAVHELVVAGSRFDAETKAARAALARAERAARDARIPALMAEVEATGSS